MSRDSHSKGLGDLTQIESELLIEKLIGPDWIKALEKIETDGDSSDLGRLLQTFVPPLWIAKEIGKMLTPREGYRGPSLRVKLPGRSRQAAFAELSKKHRAYRLVKKYEASGYGTEAAIVEVMALTGYARSTLFEIKSMNFEQEFLKIVGEESESSEKT